MAYQNVGTPRFYVNALEWLAVNEMTTIDSLFRTLPVIPSEASIEYGDGLSNQIPLSSDLHKFSGDSFHYIAFLGHNSAALVVDTYYSGVGNIVNGDLATTNLYSGFSISATTAPPSTVTSNSAVGSVLIGTYYDMPNAPNLSLTMSREYGGTKEFTTHNGSSMSNTMWNKPPMWGNLGAWELGTGTPSLTKSGRRTWQLKFSYMDDGDLWGSNQSLSTYLDPNSIGYDLDDILGDFGANLVTDGTFPDFDNWEEGEGWSVGSNKATCSSGNNDLSQTIGDVTANTYNIKFEITDYTSGGLIVQIGNSSVFTTSGVGSREVNRTVVGGNVLRFYGDGFRGSISNVSVKQLEPSNFGYNLLTDDSFFSQVWHKTLGGTLPFIFQPDSSNNNPDQFCIARFKDSSLKATQSAHNVYDISLSIEEVW